MAGDSAAKHFFARLLQCLRVLEQLLYLHPASQASLLSRPLPPTLLVEEELPEALDDDNDHGDGQTDGPAQRTTVTLLVHSLPWLMQARQQQAGGPAGEATEGNHDNRTGGRGEFEFVSPPLSKRSLRQAQLRVLARPVLCAPNVAHASCFAP